MSLIDLEQFAAEPNGFSTLLAQIREWQDEAVLQEAHQRWEASLPGQTQIGGSVFPSTAFVHQEDAPFSPVALGESLGPLQYSLWFSRPDRWRSEQVSLTPSGSVLLATAVRAGAAWWTHWVREGVVETGTVSPKDPKEFGRDFLLRPERFLAGYSLSESPEPGTWLGRPVWRARVVPVLPGRHLDTHRELFIDREFGCVLRQAELLDAEPFRVQETVAIAFNEELSDDLFPLDPPAGVPVAKPALRRAMDELIRQSGDAW